MLKLSKELNFNLHKIFIEAKKFHNGAYSPAKVGNCLKCTQSWHQDSMAAEALEKALMGTSPRHIWASTPNKRESGSAKHHNELVFLINISFLS